MTIRPTSSASVVAVENSGGAGPFLLVCEHASNRFPKEWGTLGLTPEERRAHIAWDPGALALARGLSRALDSELVHCRVSRLVYDCNRPPDAPAAMAEASEVYGVPGNAGLSPAARVRRATAVYLPFQQKVQARIAARLAEGRETLIATIHSFTPVYRGQPRAVELGVIHDADARLAMAVLAEARARTGLRAEMNAPYSAADGVTHTLRLHAAPYGLANVMLEIRNDLLATASDQERMAATLAEVLSAARTRMSRPEPSTRAAV